MSLPKACIFDLDGVIVDTVEFHYKAWKSVANELGIDFGKEENEALKGVSRIDSMKRILNMGGIEKTEAEILELTERKNAIYVAMISKMTPADVLPGVMDMLALLKANNIEIAVGSSSKNTPVILKSVELDKTFPVVVDGNQVTHSKPHPEVFLKGAERLGISTQDCLVIEDAVSGVAAAKAGGMRCLGVGDPEILAQADKVVPNLIGIDLPFLAEL